ncbi:MAG: DUF456 domain-containing protein [Candidatus Zixiibacteriota bacterium]
MTFTEILLFAAALIVMLIGLLGVIVPIIPGLPLIWFAALCYALLTDFQAVSREFLFSSAILVLVVTILQYLFTVYGAKRLGASRWGTLGAFVGMVVGLFLGSIFGVIIGPLLGAVLFELLVGKTFSQSLKAGFGTFIGFLFGTISQLIVSAILIGIFIYRVLFT